jgi:hypothetical protein
MLGLVMNRLLYEHSTSYEGHLIIPFVFGAIDQQTIYSYKLLSELGHKGELHKLENPAGMYANSLSSIITIAKEHLDYHSDVDSKQDYFKNRYTYQNHLIIILRQGEKYFYDHYPPHELNNIAAPKIFASERECLKWIKQGLSASA